MLEAQSINAEHKDLVHDVAYDFYGERMATCSSDQFVKIWDQDEKGSWQLSSNWKAHSGSVWKVTWAHPEFGQLIATCSFDRTAAVWEEMVGESVMPGEKGKRHWKRRASLVDSRTSVTDVKFAPKQMGLLLATCSADGLIRIYEAPDVMNLNQWTLQHEINNKISCSSLTWNNSFHRLHAPLLAVGSDEPNPSSGGKVALYEYSVNNNRWDRLEVFKNITEPVHDIAFAPPSGRSYHMLGIGSKDVRIITIKPLINAPPTTGNTNKYDFKETSKFTDHSSTVWRVCWNVNGTILASSGDDGCVRVWKMIFMSTFKCVAVLKGDGDLTQQDDNSSTATTPTGIQPTPLTAATMTARYFKLGKISTHNETPKH